MEPAQPTAARVCKLNSEELPPFLQTAPSHAEVTREFPHQRSRQLPSVKTHLAPRLKIHVSGQKSANGTNPDLEQALSPLLPTA